MTSAEPSALTTPLANPYEGLSSEILQDNVGFFFLFKRGWVFFSFERAQRVCDRETRLAALDTGFLRQAAPSIAVDIVARRG